MASQFTAGGVESRSTLNPPQMNDFFNEMKKTVWKVCVKKESRRGQERVGEEFYTGVCIRDDGLILTVFFNLNNLLEIDVKGPNEEQYSKAELVHHNMAAGLALVRANHLTSYNYIEFAPERSFLAEQHLYAIVYPRDASSSILLRGHLAYNHDPNSDTGSWNCPACRKVGQLPEKVCPDGLDDEVSLLQIAALGASDEFQGRTDHHFSNQWGLKEGRGGPVFDATGHLVGLVAFQQAGFDFAIDVALLTEFVTKFFPSRGQSGQPSYGKSRQRWQSKKKQVGPSSFRS